MKNEVNPKRAILILGIAVVLMVGGIFLGRYIRDESGGTAESVDATQQSPEAEPTREVKMELVPDGIVGIEETPEPTKALTPTPTAVPCPTPTPAAPAGNQTPATGSTGGGSAPTAPVSTPAPTPAPTPAGGSTNSSGQEYVPGFGWVTPSTSGNQCIPTDGDGDINKQVGTMG